MKPMQRHLLATAIVAALSASAYALPVHAQSTQNGNNPTTQKEKKPVEKLKKIVVTGSLIPTAEIDTATPVTTITLHDIKAQGFNNIYQAHEIFMKITKHSIESIHCHHSGAWLLVAAQQ